jgi:hypothetical protein
MNTLDNQQASLVVQKLKDLHLEIARCWGISADVIAGATFGLGVTMMFESGYDEVQIVEIVRDIVSDLSAPADDRGAS